MLAQVMMLLLFQSDRVRQMDTVEMANAARVRAFEAERKEISEKEKREFERKFNDFVSKLAAFTEEYNGSKGQVWPAKKAEAVTKAFEALRHTESWKVRAAGSGKASENRQALNSAPEAEREPARAGLDEK